MSNPMSNLRKGRKAPLHLGMKNGVPFRTGSNYSYDEASLLDDVTGNMAASRISQNAPLPKLVPPYGSSRTSPRQSVTPSVGPTDHDLMSLMMTRLGALEAKVESQQIEISVKNKKISIYEDKLKILQKARDGGNSDRCQELEKKCLRLQRQVHDMEAFLEDYGMIWVGKKASDEDDKNELESISDDGSGLSSPTGSWRPESPFDFDLWASVPGGELQVDYNLIIKNIEELNVLAGEGIAKIQRTTDGARLKMPDPIQLTLYANGIVMFSGPFRPFTDPTTQTCIRDMTDGFFPSELQHRYPDGIPFSVTDKRNVFFKDRLSEGFTGVGQVLGGDMMPSRLIPSNINKARSSQTVPNMNEESTLPGPKLSVDQFLNKLPSSVIKDGKIIDVRSGLSDAIKGPSGAAEDKITVLETAAVQEMKDRMALDEGSRPPSSRQITTLRIKSDGGQTFIVKMKFSETIGHLRNYLDNQMSSTTYYEIMSTFPKRVYEDHSATLQECGLVPNAALHLRMFKK